MALSAALQRKPKRLKKEKDGIGRFLSVPLPKVATDEVLWSADGLELSRKSKGSAKSLAGNY